MPVRMLSQVPRDWPDHLPSLKSFRHVRSAVARQKQVRSEELRMLEEAVRMGQHVEWKSEYTLDDVRVGIERERQLIAEAEAYAARLRLRS